MKHLTSHQWVWQMHVKFVGFKQKVTIFPKQRRISTEANSWFPFPYDLEVNRQGLCYDELQSPLTSPPPAVRIALDCQSPKSHPCLQRPGTCYSQLRPTHTTSSPKHSPFCPKPSIPSVLRFKYHQTPQRPLLPPAALPTYCWSLPCAPSACRQAEPPSFPRLSTQSGTSLLHLAEISEN